VRIDLNGAKGIIDFEQAGVTEENEHSLTYNIPIRTEGKSSFPFDKIQVWVRVNKQQHAFENLDLKVLAPFRLKVIAKVKGAEISADYTTVDADHPPQASHINVHAKVAVLFGAFDVHQEITRTDFKPVKPYDERFSVKAGPLKTLGF
jgi:citrate lyase beta subunit